MRVIICGSRQINDYEVLKESVIESGFDVTEVVSGCANGVDKLGERWAGDNGKGLHRFPAEWSVYGSVAGRIRNRKMANFVSPDGGVIAVWDGFSKGTAHMIQLAKEAGLRVFIKSHSPPSERE